MSLNREKILGSADVGRSITTVSVPEWGGDVKVRVMSGTERGQFETLNSTAPKETIRARVAASTICDDDGNLLFSLADIESLGNLSSMALDRVLDAALKINGMAPKSVEDEAKNFEASRS